MHTAPTVAHVTASLCIPRGSRLAWVAIPTPCATQRELALKKNVKRRILRAKRCREEPELLMHGERLEVALQQGFQAFTGHNTPRASWGLCFVGSAEAFSPVSMRPYLMSIIYFPTIGYAEATC